MAITLDGTTGVITAELDGPLDASNLTGALPAIDGSALTSLDAANLTGTLPAIDGSAVTALSASSLTGALPAIDGSALTGVGGSTAYGAVGTYAFLYYAPHGYPTPGFTSSGSNLYPANGYSYGGMSGNRTAYGSVSGTWSLMGLLGYHNGTARGQADTSNSVWVRIS